MAFPLKQSTARTVKVGPFLDVDGAPVTGLTISQADIRLSKNGGNIAQSNNAAGATHDELGVYDVPLDTTDTGTLGSLDLYISEAGALICHHEYLVVPANVYDSGIAASDVQQVHVIEISNDLITAAALNADAVTEIVTAIFARAFAATAGSYTFDQLMRMMAAVLLAKVSGMDANAPVFRNIADSANIVSATTDEDGNRLTITLNP